MKKVLFFVVIMALASSVMSCWKEKETHVSNTICTTSDADCDEQTEQNIILDKL